MQIEKPESKSEKTAEARRMRGLGEDAYWVGSLSQVRLYVSGDKFVRISVGGSW